ncbi:piggyBac transposable element-derived protein 4-like [Aplysia californica]|uniref:PiggyBac transposable element-derived protein 4-like n=1 Tax=Aplysia californica TaxID=6500 RepID=A0ABM0JNF1_APLCA|nr:piggyBac transposable element-derived protein 4-like [Aplysia californica]
MEITVVKNSYREYWESDGVNFLSETPGFRKVLTRDRFLTLWTFLHIVDERDPELNKNDKIYKVRPFLSTLLEKFKHHYKPKQFLSLDEGMIPTKNRLAIKQYIKDKPIKFGIKSFILCEGDTGYILSSEIYTGREEQAVDGLGVVGNIVYRLLLAGECENKKHILTMDRYYNSVDLFKYLLREQNTFAVGTAMTNRKHYPKTLIRKKMNKRGDYEFVCQGSLVAMVWMDRRPINFLSTCHDPTLFQHARRRNKDGTQENVVMPQLVKDYNSFMGGTDKNDQMARLNKTRRHYRWPRRLFMKFVMWAVYNAYVLFQNVDPEKAKKYTLRNFLNEYCLALVGEYRTAAVQRPREIEGQELPLRLQNVGLHFPEIGVDDTGNHLCAVCSYKHQKFRKENPAVPYKDCPVKAVKSNVKCGYCNRHLCIKKGSTCWKDWHTKSEYWR